MTPSPAALALVAAAALAVCALTLRVALPALRRRGVLDVPGSRSLHERPTVRGGGVGLLVAVPVVVLLTRAVAPDVLDAAGRWPVVLLAGPFVLGLVGLLDDLRSVSVTVRMAAQVVVGVVVGVALVHATGSAWAWVPVVTVLVVALVNATNFMDGANGLVAGHAVVTGAWYAVLAAHAGVGSAAVVAAAVAGAALGFLPVNLPVAKAFLGDVGSYLLGASWAVLAAWLSASGASLVAVVAPLLVLLTDTGATMLRRALAGDRITTAHRLHVYQRLVRGGWSHARVTATVVAATATLCALSLPSVLHAPATVRLPAIAVGVLLCLAYLGTTAVVGGGARWRASREAP